MLRLLRSDRIAEEDQGKREPRQRVLAEVRHDRGRRKTELHFREAERRAFGDVNEIAHDREAKTEAERVALHLRDADQRRNPQGALEFDEPRGFVMDRRSVASRALASRAENLAARPNAQDSRGGTRCFAAKFREHSVKHCASDFIFVFGIIQSEVQDVAGPLDHHPNRRAGAGRFNRFR